MGNSSHWLVSISYIVPSWPWNWQQGKSHSALDDMSTSDMASFKNEIKSFPSKMWCKTKGKCIRFKSSSCPNQFARFSARKTAISSNITKKLSRKSNKT
jgi:hypothetical protein